MTTTINSHWPETDDDGEGYFAIPCRHPDAKDGIFKAVPQGFNFEGGMTDVNGHSGHKTYMMADVSKLIAKIEETDPKMMAHAQHSYNLSYSNASKLLSSNDQFPYDTGTFSFDTRARSQEYYNFHNSYKGSFNELLEEFGIRGIFNAPADDFQDRFTLTAGQASMLMLIQDLGIDRIPIGLRADNEEDMGRIVEEIGYGDFPVIRPQEQFPNYNLEPVEEEHGL